MSKSCKSRKSRKSLLTADVPHNDSNLVPTSDISLETHTVSAPEPEKSIEVASENMIVIPDISDRRTTQHSNYEDSKCIPLRRSSRVRYTPDRLDL